MATQACVAPDKTKLYGAFTRILNKTFGDDICCKTTFGINHRWLIFFSSFALSFRPDDTLQHRIHFRRVTPRFKKIFFVTKEGQYGSPETFKICNIYVQKYILLQHVKYKLLLLVKYIKSSLIVLHNTVNLSKCGSTL